MVRAMHARYVELGSLESVGEQYGISREWARKLFLRFGLPLVDASDRHAQKAQEAQERREEVFALYREHGNVKPVAQAANLAQWQVEGILSELEGRALYQRQGEQSMYSKEDRLDAIRTAASILGEPLGRLAYRQLRDKRSDLDLPTDVTIVRAFNDDWEGACRLAGVSAPVAARRHRSDWIPREVCDEALRACRSELGHIPTYSEYRRWSEGKDVPRGVTVRSKNMGRWRTALASAFSDFKEEAA